MATASLLLFIAFALTNWFAVAKENTDVELVAKPAALASLLIFAATSHTPSLWLLAALALGLLGDVYLMLPGDFFISGLAAFLFGHVAYIVDMQAPLTGRLLCFLLLALAISPVALRIVHSIDSNAVRVGVVAYMAAISFMAASAIASGNILAACGGLLFVASDSLLGWDRFVGRLRHGHLLAITTYHLAQLALVLALR